MLAAAAAIQRTTPSLLPVIAITPLNFGAAPGAPQIATVNNAQGMVGLFDSAASKETLTVANDASLFEAYYKAFVGLNAAAGRPTWARPLRTGKTSANFLGKNLAAALAPTADDMTRYNLNQGTQNKLSQLGLAFITTAKAFKLGLTQSVMMPAMRDDPHGAFNDMNNLRGTVAQLGKMFDEFMNVLIAIPDPVCSARSLADNVVMTVHGDTPKNPRDRGGWPDGTPNNSNWLYVMGNGHLKTGWFGGTKRDNTVQGFDATGKPAAYNGANTAKYAMASIAYAIAKRDERAISAFANGTTVANNFGQPKDL
jgi:hypothetical protein